MIFLTYCSQNRVTYVLYDGTLIHIPDNSGNEGQAFLQTILTHARSLSQAERRLAHHRPDCRLLDWTWKIRHTARRWNGFYHFGTVV